MSQPRHAIKARLAKVHFNEILKKRTLIHIKSNMKKMEHTSLIHTPDSKSRDIRIFDERSC